MGKQMACQLSGPQLIEWAQKFIDLAAGKEKKYLNIGQLLEAEVADPKDRVRMGTSFVVLSELAKEGLTAHDVRNVIRWRDDKGGQGCVEIQFMKSGTDKRALRLAQEERLRSFREAISLFGPGFLFR
jgi:hypothetical protein